MATQRDLSSSTTTRHRLNLEEHSGFGTMERRRPRLEQKPNYPHWHFKSPIVCLPAVDCLRSMGLIWVFLHLDIVFFCFTWD